MAENDQNRSIWPAVAIGSIAAIEAGHFFYSGCVWSTATHSPMCGDGAIEVSAFSCCFYLSGHIFEALIASDPIMQSIAITLQV